MERSPCARKSSTTALIPFEASTCTSDVCAAIFCVNRKIHASENATFVYFRMSILPFSITDPFCNDALANRSGLCFHKYFMFQAQVARGRREDGLASDEYFFAASHGSAHIVF